MYNSWKLKLMGVVLVFVTISLVFKMDFKTQVEYVFGNFDVDIGEMSTKSVEKVINHSIEEAYNSYFQTYTNPETIENKISTEKYEKLLDVIDLEKDYRAILIRGYETDEYISARYYINLKENESLQTIKDTYSEKLINNGFKQDGDTYKNDTIELKFVIKWDCLILIVKGL